MSNDDLIFLNEYSQDWRNMADAEILNIRRVVPKIIIEKIEHIGSTAVPGCAAKPILDIAVQVSSIKNALEAVTPLESLDYIFWKENPDPTHMFFVKGMPPYGKMRTHHVHFFEPERFETHIAFRNLLIQTPDILKDYQILKTELAAKFKYDREAYTTGKSEFIQNALSKLPQYAHWKD